MDVDDVTTAKAAVDVDVTSLKTAVDVAFKSTELAICRRDQRNPPLPKTIKTEDELTRENVETEGKVTEFNHNVKTEGDIVRSCYDIKTDGNLPGCDDVAQTTKSREDDLVALRRLLARLTSTRRELDALEVAVDFWRPVRRETVERLRLLAVGLSQPESIRNGITDWSASLGVVASTVIGVATVFVPVLLPAAIASGVAAGTICVNKALYGNALAAVRRAMSDEAKLCFVKDVQMTLVVRRQFEQLYRCVREVHDDDVGWNVVVDVSASGVNRDAVDVDVGNFPSGVQPSPSLEDGPAATAATVTAAASVATTRDWIKCALTPTPAFDELDVWEFVVASNAMLKDDGSKIGAAEKIEEAIVLAKFQTKVVEDLKTKLGIPSNFDHANEDYRKTKTTSTGVSE